MKTRTMNMRIGNIECSTGWGSSTITFLDYRGEDQTRKVVLAIEDPSDVEYIRDRLNEIEAYWKKRLGVTS